MIARLNIISASQNVFGTSTCQGTPTKPETSPDDQGHDRPEGDGRDDPFEVGDAGEPPGPVVQAEPDVGQSVRTSEQEPDERQVGRDDAGTPKPS